MKGVKTFSLLFISVLLILIASFILLFTWGYYKFYYRVQIEKPKTEIVSKEQDDGNDRYRDSLQQLYTSTFNSLNTSFNTIKNADSFHIYPELNQVGYYKLKNEIETILKNHPLKADLDIARQKIIELQNKLNELNNKNLNVEDENKRLNGKITQLTNEVKIVEQNINPDKSENTIPPKNSEAAPLFTISQILVAAITGKENAEQETNEADHTEKLVTSFTIKSNLSQKNNAEIFAVVLQPDGNVLQGSWESGTFETHEGRKVYSSNLHFEYSTATSKRLSFSLSTEQFQKGAYTILIYYNGMIIGRGFKTLY